MAAKDKIGWQNVQPIWKVIFIWFELAHKKLDEAIFATYGCKPDLSDEEILERWLSLNLERAK